MLGANACLPGQDDAESTGTNARAAFTTAAATLSIAGAAASSGAAAFAVDGNLGTRWESSFADPQWIRFDLGSAQELGSIELVWETANASNYTVEGSNDDTNWTTLATQTGMAAGERTDTVALAGNFRYVRVHGTARTTEYGYSLWEATLYSPDDGPPSAGDTRWDVVAATASSLEFGTALEAADGNMGTRWASEAADPQWVRFDLGQARDIGRVVIHWETASASAYTIEGSNDDASWTVLASKSNMAVGARSDDLSGLAGSYRYLRIHGTARTTGYGYSIWETEIYAGGGGQPPGGGDPWSVSGATASSTEYGTPAEAADGNMGTRWASEAADPQWIRFDLGQAREIGRVVIHWETASASAYAIEGSNDDANWTTLATKTGMAAGARSDDVGGLAGSYRYLRIHGTARTTGYGYSIFETEIYATGGGSTEPPPTGPFTMSLSVPYVEYLQIELVPPSLEGTDILVIQNNTLDTQVSYAGGTQVTIHERQSSIFGRNVFFNESGTSANPLSVNMNQNRNVAVQLVPIDDGGENPVYDDPIEYPETAPRPGAFALTAPGHQEVYHQDRTPVLSWAPVAGASNYRVYLNITRDDYDFSQPGSLLERYTLIGETNQTSLQAPSLPDRWTYRWYVEAVTGGGIVTSENRAFSVYLPDFEDVDDGVNIVAGARDLNKNGTIEPYEDWRLPIETRIDDLISRMSPMEKAMQLFFVVEENPTAGWHFGPALPHDLFAYQKATAATNLGIPFVSAGDTTHGYVTSFPTGVGMAATRDPSLAYDAANMQRREHVVAGYRGTLGPIAEVGTKAIYPRIQEGGGEDADLVAAIMRAMITGYQGGPELNPSSLLPTTKHWPGEGAGGEAGITFDGVTIKYHMKPFQGAIDSGTGAVMPGYAGSDFLDPGGRGAGDSIGILAYLREVLDYDGLIITDWLPSGAWVRAANAGSDVMGGADPSAIDMNTFIAEVDNARLHKALRRIFRVKFALGIFENPYGDLDAVTAEHHSDANVAIAQRAAEASLTLLKNDSLLPFRMPAGSKLLVTGPRADDGLSHAIWRSAFEAAYGDQTIAAAISARGQQAGLDVVVDTSLAPTNQGYAGAVVVLGERSYTHGTAWDKEEPYIPQEQRDLLSHLSANNIPFVVVYILPRPYVIDFEVSLANAIVAAYRPGGAGGGPAVARLLFGDIKPQGKLPFQLPRNMTQVGNDNHPEIGEVWDIPYDMGATAAERQQIRDLINANQPVPPTFGDPLFQYGAGYEDFHLSDGSAPSAPQITSPTGGQVIGQAPVFTWNPAQDAETGIQYYEIVVDGVLRDTTLSTSYNAKGLHLSSGGHNLVIRARNWAEQTTASATVGFQFIDAVAPTQPAVVAVNALGGAQARIIWRSAGDNESGILEYVLRAGSAVLATVPGSDKNVAYRNLASTSTATSSSRQDDLRASYAVDGDPATRWSSAAADDQWLELDLGGLFALDRVALSWEAAYASGYVIETSRDRQSWSVALDVTGGTGGEESRALSVAAARYVRMRATVRATAYGVSLWEMAVMGRPVEEAQVGVNAPASITVEAVDRHGNRTTSAPYAY
ncbi:discoidin domain-containing protein [Haliangium ochraceum]|uniref:beta-glucosidase n=1 Tax=Haliangium ochraceum (strain DSM 14365 / JCM 11303 / SMP-2) TaxID=502025 RepID=D0LSQ6_HALO1|nr:discoidin domain-containing protein [Haliangium ochraceum]ACY17278.1 coagulation factor 5/8 type domain protein [Haliangium ochraceum DSM 14365]